MAAFKARPKRAICICCLRYGRTFKRGQKPYLRPRFKRGRSLYLKPRLKRGLRQNLKPRFKSAAIGQTAASEF